MSARAAPATSPRNEESPLKVSTQRNSDVPVNSVPGSFPALITDSMACARAVALAAAIPLPRYCPSGFSGSEEQGRDAWDGDKAKGHDLQEERSGA
jgi:hypothetical protein